MHLEFIQDKADDVIILLNEEELSASSAPILQIEFVAVSEESRRAGGMKKSKKW